jgi:hypothetical protein
MMEVNREILDERVRTAKVIALRNRTGASMEAYGQAIMDRWGAVIAAGATITEVRLRSASTD